jgi:hypothetical protein
MFSHASNLESLIVALEVQKDKLFKSQMAEGLLSVCVYIYNFKFKYR